MWSCMLVIYFKFLLCLCSSIKSTTHRCNIWFLLYLLVYWLFIRRHFIRNKVTEFTIYLCAFNVRMCHFDVRQWIRRWTGDIHRWWPVFSLDSHIFTISCENYGPSKCYFCVEIFALHFSFLETRHLTVCSRKL
jgi:hypothetical protein